MRDLDGTLLQTVFREATDSPTIGGWGAGLLDNAHAGMKVVLSFEQNQSPHCAWVSNIQVVSSGAPTNFVTNGNFEAGATGWRVVTGKASQNVRSAQELLLGLQVQRSFFTLPNQLWGRLTDTFHTPSAAPISATILYASNLGSEAHGVIYYPTGSQNKALSSFDTDDGREDRDCGFVFGSADTVEFTSATSEARGNSDLFFRLNLSVAPGQTVTLVNFILLSGDRSFSADTKDFTARATKIDAVAVDIAANFRTNFAYQRGLTQQQLDTLTNF